MTVIKPNESGPQRRRLDGYLKGIAAKDKASLAALYEETRVGVYSYTLSLLKNREDAEDALQEVYLTVYSSAPHYKSCGKPLEWLMTVTRNICMTKLRARKRTVPINEAELLQDDSDIVSAEDRLLLREILASLSDEEREIVALHAVSGLKYREIGEVLGIPGATVGTKYHRAVKKLRSKITKGGVQT